MASRRERTGLDQMSEDSDSPCLPGTLYVCGTPIGNLGDITRRAVETLSSVDAVLAEDTRVTRKLLSYLNISKPIISYHEHNKDERNPEILQMLKSGKSLALVSDAGMPGISDPGADLVRFLRQEGIHIVCIPGPSALTSALSISGFRAGSFCFKGFLPRKGKGRDVILKEMAEDPGVIVLYDSPFRVVKTLCDLRDALGKDREAVVARELTKLHEEIVAGTLETLAGIFESRAREGRIRGEFVIIVGPREKYGRLLDNSGHAAGEVSEADRDAGEDAEGVELARRLMESGVSLRDAVRQVAQQTGISRRQLYQRVISFIASKRDS